MKDDFVITSNKMSVLASKHLNGAFKWL